MGMSWRSAVVLSVIAVVLIASNAWSQGQRVACYLDQGAYHIGDGDFTATNDPELVAQNTVVGPKWTITFSVDRPTTVFIALDELTGVGGGDVAADAAVARVSLSGAELGTITPRDNHQAWSSAWYHAGVPGKPETLLIECTAEGNWDDFVFRGVKLVYDDPNAVVTLVAPGQVLQEAQGYTGAQVGEPAQPEPPIQTFEPMPGMPLVNVQDGQAVQWGPVWSVIRIGYQMVLRRGDGQYSVILPLFGGEPAIQRGDGLGAVRSSLTPEWFTTDLPNPVTGFAARVQLSGMAGEQPCQLGPWSVSFVVHEGLRWMMLSDARGTVFLTDNGDIWYADEANPNGICFTQQ